MKSKTAIFALDWARNPWTARLPVPCPKPRLGPGGDKARRKGTFGFVKAHQAEYPVTPCARCWVSPEVILRVGPGQLQPPLGIRRRQWT